MSRFDRGFYARALFRFLNETGVWYCVVGDTRDYPDRIGSDIDIVVPHHTLLDFPAVVSQFAQLHQLRLVQVLRHERTAMYFVLAWIDSDGKPQFLAPDVCSDYRRHGVPILTAAEILEHSASAADGSGGWTGFPVPRPAMQFIYYVIKKIDKGQIDQRQADYLATCWRQDRDGCITQLRRFWEGETVRSIADAMDDGNWLPLSSDLDGLRKQLHRSIPFAPGARWQNLMRKIVRAFRPSGLTIALLGPDGCGKSSVIEAVSQEMAAAFRKVHYVHLRPRVVGGGHAQEPVSEPHAMPPRGALASTAKLAWFLFDYWSGYLLSIWPRRMRSTLVIFDRYYHDVTVDPRRYRYGGPMLLARLVGWLVPKPDIWFVLDAPAEVVWARKSEVDLAETQRQREAYLMLLERLHGVAVDVSQELPDVVRQVEIEILDRLERRTAKRWHCPPLVATDGVPAGPVAGGPEPMAGVASGNERHSAG